MEIPTEWCRTAVGIRGTDAKAAATGRWWLVTNDGRVLVPVRRDAEGSRCMHAGADYSPGPPGFVYVDHRWLVNHRRHGPTCPVKRLADRVLALAARRAA